MSVSEVSFSSTFGKIDLDADLALGLDNTDWRLDAELMRRRYFDLVGNGNALVVAEIQVLRGRFALFQIEADQVVRRDDKVFRRNRQALGRVLDR